MIQERTLSFAKDCGGVETASLHSCFLKGITLGSTVLFGWYPYPISAEQFALIFVLMVLHISFPSVRKVI